MTESYSPLPASPITRKGRDSNWLLDLEQLAFAHGGQAGSAVLKAKVEDFRVTEIMDVEPSQEGEHVWLDVTKTKANTDQAAKAIARFAGVAYRDVSYSGMKDYFAVTRQWFSVWMPRGPHPQWEAFEHPDIAIHKVARHHKKLRRGLHQGNRFEILLRDLQVDKSGLENRLEAVGAQGVPNYFGLQRFGRLAGNLPQSYAMLVDGKRIKNKNLRGLLLSSARSWLFNRVVSARVSEQSWDTLYPHEPTNLQGSNSVFLAEQDVTLEARLKALDIHPTAPLWGDGAEQSMLKSPALHEWERAQLGDFQDLMQGLVDARVAYQRRPLRSVVNDLSWELDDTRLKLKFTLIKGQFATSVLRELVATQ